MDYPISIFPLSEDDGGGYVAVAPDLMGCMSDGETPAEALENGQQAVREWLETATRRGLAIPAPGSGMKRERQFREHLLAQLKDVAASVDHVEERIEELERAISDLQGRQDHMDAWSRFSEITAMPLPVQKSEHAGNC